jgi:branched-chain amino acid aminotransferase
MSVFETVRVVCGRAQFWTEHTNRLKTAVTLCGLQVLDEALEKAKERLLTEDLNGVARLYVTAGDGGPETVVTQSRVALLVEERARNLPNGYSLTVSDQIHLPLFGGLKTANYWKHAESLRMAKLLGADEALLCGTSGLVISACMANVFLRTSKGWHTPRLANGARDGVVRNWVLERFRVAEADIHATALDEVDAGFLTSSWLGVMPINFLAGRELEQSSQVLALRNAFEGEGTSENL